MIINGQLLLQIAPIKNMLSTKQKEFGVSHGLSETGYDVRLAQTIEFCVEDQTPYVRVNGKGQNGRFTIASTMEEFDMPSDLSGVVHDKSTHARRGLSVFNTVIEPGWSGFLTLELVYHGADNLLLPAGIGIAQIIFSEVAEPQSYAGKYQGQANMPVKAILEQ